jgi:hypothetical protein
MEFEHRPYHHPENLGQQPDTEERAREALTVFVAGEPRNSARSKAFSNLVSVWETRLPRPAGRVREADRARYWWSSNEEVIEDAIWERRVKTNRALVKGYSVERARVLVRLGDYYGAWLKGPGRGRGFIGQEHGFARELLAIRAEVFARQQHARHDPPHE